MKKIFFKNEKGFTIIETLVAITILMISIAGPLTIAQKSLMAAIHAKDQVTASFLAQERMEKIKNEKSIAVSNGNFVNWARDYDGLNNICDDKYCDLYQSSGGQYLLDSNAGIKSKFSIKYFVDPVNLNNNEAKVTVQVKWLGGSLENVVTLENFIFNVEL